MLPSGVGSLGAVVMAQSPPRLHELTSRWWWSIRGVSSFSALVTSGEVPCVAPPPKGQPATRWNTRGTSPVRPRWIGSAAVRTTPRR